ncbi:Coenzyme F420 hydrogenase/dehydrogenase, beta subunit C-terminal domain [Magnetococcales bacterium HHB-1]
MSFTTLSQKIIDIDLCTRCGTCVAICPEHAITFSDPLDLCLPMMTTPLSVCQTCSDLCYRFCPGAGIDFPAMNQRLFKSAPPDYLLGHAREIHVGYATEAKTRSQAASGGIITALLEHLLRTGAIEGAICLTDIPGEPLRPIPVVITNPSQLTPTQQSRYSIAPVNTILRQAATMKGPLAIVALPDQVHSIRMMQQEGDPLVRSISLIIGSYCGVVQHTSSVVNYLHKQGVHDTSLIRKVEYRAGAWPGKLRITLHDNRTFEMAKFYANYMTLFFAMQRSLACVDLSNELADISVGDAWAPRYEERSEGFSLVITRTEAGEQALTQATKQGVIHLQKTSRDDALEMHSHGLFNKKVAVWARLSLRRWLKKGVPSYGYQVIPPFKIRLTTTLIALIFTLGTTRFMRLFLNLLPLKLTSALFAAIRKPWRKITRKKKGGFITRFPLWIKTDLTK